MEKNLIIILVIGAFIIFILGGGTGIFYQTQKYAPQIEKLQILETTAKALSSPVVFDITALGKVTNIDGRNITLNRNNQELTIKIKEDAKITSAFKSAVPGENRFSVVEKPDTFENIKKGDGLRINIKVLENGKLEGDVVTIISYLNSNF